MTTDAIAPPRDSDVSLTVSSVGTSNINISSFAETCLKICFLNCSLPRTGGWNRRSIYGEYSVIVVVFINIPITRQILPPVSRSSCSCSVGVFFSSFFHCQITPNLQPTSEHLLSVSLIWSSVFLSALFSESPAGMSQSVSPCAARSVDCEICGQGLCVSPGEEAICLWLPTGGWNHSNLICLSGTKSTRKKKIQNKKNKLN